MGKAAQVAAAEGRKRKIRIEEYELSASSVQLKTRRLSPDNSDSSPANSTCETDGPDHVSASCSSSNGSGELAKASSQFVDLDEENHEAASSGDSLDYTEERRETTPAESGELESTAMPESRDRTTTTMTTPTTDKMPSPAELEQFFTAAENNLQKKFVERYNYDIVKDQPLEGQYEWIPIQLNP